MTLITGDTHGDFTRFLWIENHYTLNAGDTVIVLGDAGLNYNPGRIDEARKGFVSNFPWTTFCIHGNHEIRPYDIKSYKTKPYRGGVVWYEEEYPNILFAKDGEIYDFDGYSCLVIGGAYSVDKFLRLASHMNWFPNEQPSEEIKAYVERQSQKHGNKIDIVLSHTCPYKYEPREVFLRNIDQSAVDKSTEKWLDTIEERLDYKKWYCGHFHTEKSIDKMRFMFQDIEELRI